MKRKITITVDSSQASSVLSELCIDTAEITIEAEDSGATYKKLSGTPGILDWEFTENSKIQEMPEIKREGICDISEVKDASILFEALYALKLNHPSRSFESLGKVDLEEMIDFISNNKTSFNHLAIKVTLEKYYQSHEEAKKDVLRIFKEQWSSVLSYKTVLGFMFHLYGKTGEKKEEN